ncbi:MAG TPA: type I DNA topoisomerase [Candidatus Pacearchaeota archaeon]|nr:type I DNA topoisomerase [Candidatus Pacearchaeota archaeon]HOK94456.1 type I DNA topoisomerase [Candidatus Pacearchaeota archaeon]HPO75518.1 type I DNA topoisomerase [Candidatus Pacearchaeota archaeon]
MFLVIVESPTKSKTIQNFLKGSNFAILPSYGHIRDLPKSELGIDIEHSFEPKYIIPLKARKHVNILKKEAKKAEKIILATDEDREGESIAWHLVQALQLGKFQAPNSELGGNQAKGEKRLASLNSKSQTNPKPKIKNSKPYQRIVFHEITKQAIEEALKNPRDIDMNLVNAQQARRVLDRLVGYKLSPLLWKKVRRGLSAGRVQSVAVRLVCDREKEMESFKAEEYWTIEALLQKIPNRKWSQSEALESGGRVGVQIPNKSKIQNPKSKTEFKALLFKKNGKAIPKLGIKKEKEAKEIVVEDLKDAEYKVENIERKEIKRNPLPPFTTSTLQQESWQRLHFSAKFTMQIAQSLYERGYITYHRTDSLNLAEQSLFQAKEFIEKKFGKNYWPGYFRRYKTKSKSAQEAHEAIRPTQPEKTVESLKSKLKPAEEKLYGLIWKRFIASQMAQAIFDSTIVDVKAKNYTFRAAGQVLKFDGFLKVYPIKFAEEELPELEKNELLKLIKLTPLQHFTQPPSRYTEATLIKELEKNGIGRPSTYAPILSTIQERNYVEKDEKRKLKPTKTGILVNDLLCTHFPEIVDIQFTAKMEEELDKIARGEIKWQEPIKEFYFPFEKNLEKKEKEIEKIDLTETTDEICPECGKPILIKMGRYGKFYACSDFPKCKFTKPYFEKIGVACPKCKKGEIIVRKTKKGKFFYGCSRYPECDFASWQKPKNKI